MSCAGEIHKPQLSKVTISLRVIPRAKRSEVCGFKEGILQVRLAAPPVDGKANKALIELLAKRFALKKSQIEVTCGAKARNKLVTLYGVDLERLQLEFSKLPGWEGAQPNTINSTK